MPDPATLGLAARRIYSQIEHLEIGNPDTGETAADLGWPWATICAALAAPLEPLYALLNAGGTPYAALFDLELAEEALPAEFAEALLPFTGQFFGVTDRAELSASGRRLRLRETRAQIVGTPAAIIGAARATGEGPDETADTASVTLNERLNGNARWFSVVMYDGQVPDPDATRRAIDAMTPAGRRTPDGDRFDFRVDPGWSVGQFVQHHEGDSVAAVIAAYPTIGDSVTVIPDP